MKFENSSFWQGVARIKFLFDEINNDFCKLKTTEKCPYEVSNVLRKSSKVVKRIQNLSFCLKIDKKLWDVAESKNTACYWSKKFSVSKSIFWKCLKNGENSFLWWPKIGFNFQRNLAENDGQVEINKKCFSKVLGKR